MIVMHVLHDGVCGPEPLMCFGVDVDEHRAELVARLLVTRLHEAGYAIHNVADGRCVRMPPLGGRPMTEEEQRAWQSSGGSSSGPTHSS